MKDQIKAKKKKLESVSRKRSVAVGFETNPYYEQLLEMREKKPAAYKMMSAATQLSVEAYVRAKSAAAAQAVAAKAAA